MFRRNSLEQKLFCMILPILKGLGGVCNDERFSACGLNSGLGSPLTPYGLWHLFSGLAWFLHAPSVFDLLGLWASDLASFQGRCTPLALQFFFSRTFLRLEFGGPSAGVAQTLLRYGSRLGTGSELLHPQRASARTSCKVGMGPSPNSAAGGSSRSVAA